MKGRVGEWEIEAKRRFRDSGKGRLSKINFPQITLINADKNIDFCCNELTSFIWG
jgi:hypothetical protein